MSQSNYNQSHYNQTHYLPWQSVITPKDPSHASCPSPSKVLGTFAAVNSVMLISPLIFSNSFVIRYLTCELFGSGEGKSWGYSWIFGFTFQLVANAIIAALMKHTVGWEVTYSVGDLVLLYTARPRVSWLFVSTIASLPGYWNSYMANLIAEFALQILALVYMGRTVHFASGRGYYKNSGDAAKDALKFKGVPGGALLMYTGALIYVIFFAIYFMVIIFVIGAGVNDDEIENNEGNDHTCMGLCFAFPLVINWVGSWLFWAGFVHLAGDWYCVPNLLHQGIIWGSFSFAGSALGVGV